MRNDLIGTAKVGGGYSVHILNREPFDDMWETFYHQEVFASAFDAARLVSRIQDKGFPNLNAKFADGSSAWKRQPNVARVPRAPATCKTCGATCHINSCGD
jgi:hypothetical protein